MVNVMNLRHSFHMNLRANLQLRTHCNSAHGSSNNADNSIPLSFEAVDVGEACVDQHIPSEAAMKPSATIISSITSVNVDVTEYHLCILVLGDTFFG